MLLPAEVDLDPKANCLKNPKKIAWIFPFTRESWDYVLA